MKDHTFEKDRIDFLVGHEVLMQLSMCVGALNLTRQRVQIRSLDVGVCEIICKVLHILCDWLSNVRKMRIHAKEKK